MHKIYELYPIVFQVFLSHVLHVNAVKCVCAFERGDSIIEFSTIDIVYEAVSKGRWETKDSTYYNDRWCEELIEKLLAKSIVWESRS